MKRSTKILLTLAVLLLVGYLLFQNRINGTVRAYRLVTALTQVMNDGSDAYDLVITASLQQKEKRDSLQAQFSYRQGDYYYADVFYDDDRYVILHEGDSTRVILPDKELVIAGRSDTAGCFDMARLAGEILKDYPATAFIPAMEWKKRAGLALYLLIKGDFARKKTAGGDFLAIGIDEGLAGGLEICLGRGGKHYVITTEDDEKKILIDLLLPGKMLSPPQVDTGGMKRVGVNGDELNTAIYRGALRAGGLMLENQDPPQTDGVERRWGKGLLTYVDGNRVLVAKGSHYELGEIHGTLLKREVRKLVDATLYTINWVYTMEKKSWFIDDLRGAYEREAPYIPEKYQEEMRGLAKTSGISLEEIRLTNVFPALFHCSGFALFGEATVDGVLYHGRILDYITELGLQYYPVIMIFKPDSAYAFANVSFAGFIGSVTGINEKQVTFGEMGGRGEGDWDGMPMAFLMREGLETASTLPEAVDLFGSTPRTCEYYYVISDGKIPDARGLATSPKRFDVIRPGQYHPQLPEPVKDAVLMSAGDRYKELVKRVKTEYGQINAEKAIRLMDRPVAMNAALHTVLFAPQTLEFWVANAGPDTPAPMNPYTHFDMRELLERLEK